MGFSTRGAVKEFTYTCWIGGCLAAAALYFGLYFHRISLAEKV